MPSPMHLLSWPLPRRQILGDHRGRAGLNHVLLIKTRTASGIAITKANAHLGDKGAREAFKTGAEDHAGSTAAEEEEAGHNTRTALH